MQVMEVVVAPVASAVSGSMAQVVTEAMAGQAERGGLGTDTGVPPFSVTEPGGTGGNGGAGGAGGMGIVEGGASTPAKTAPAEPPAGHPQASLAALAATGVGGLRWRRLGRAPANSIESVGGCRG